MLPYDKSFNHYKYLTWGLVYLIDMLQLPESNPEVYNHFLMENTQFREQKQHHTSTQLPQTWL